MNSKSLVETLQKVKNYAKNLKQQGMNNHPQLMSDTAIFYDSNSFELVHSSTGPAFHKTKSKIESMTTFKQSSPARSNFRAPSRQNSLTMSGKFLLDRKEVQSQNQAANTRAENRANIKHLDNFLNASVGSRGFSNKKPVNSSTYNHPNAESNKMKQVENRLLVKEQNMSKLRHSKSPSKERHAQNSNSAHGQEDTHFRMSDLNRIRKQLEPSSLIQDSRHSQSKKSQKRVQDQTISTLLAEINRLQSVISKYKTILLSVRHKYMAMQEQLRQKIANDHLMDVLKQKIQNLQNKNNEINMQLKLQKQTIKRYEHTLINKITQINRYYAQSIDQNIILKKQNQMLRKIMMIAAQPPTDNNIKKTAEPPDLPQQKSAFLRTLVKNVEAFSLKWV